MACAFSSAKRLIAPDRNALGDDLIEALECLKAWWDNGLVERHWGKATCTIDVYFIDQFIPFQLPGLRIPN